MNESYRDAWNACGPGTIHSGVPDDSLRRSRWLVLKKSDMRSRSGDHELLVERSGVESIGHRVELTQIVRECRAGKLAELTREV